MNPYLLHKLSEAAREDIVRRYLAGDKVTSIARRHGVTRAALYYHLNDRGVELRQPR